MLDWMTNGSLSYRQNCFSDVFPKQAKQLTKATQNYFDNIHQETNFPKITQIFKDSIEKMFVDPNLIEEEDKQHFIDQYISTHVANLIRSEECSKIFQNMFTEYMVKGFKQGDLETAAQGYVQFEANLETTVPSVCFNMAIDQVRMRVEQRATSLIADAESSMQKSPGSSSKVGDLYRAKECPAICISVLQ